MKWSVDGSGEGGKREGREGNIGAIDEAGVYKLSNIIKYYIMYARLA